MAGQRSSIVDAASAILNAELAASPPVTGGAFNRRDWSAAAAQVVQTLNIPSLASTQGRQRVHALVDLLADFVASTQGSAKDILTTASSDASEPSTAEAIPIIRPKETAVRPGDEVSMSVSVRNDNSNASVELSFFATELVGTADQRIPGSHVGISPRIVSLAPGGSADVVIRVGVPGDKRPGTYQGLLLATGDDHLRAIVSVRVASIRGG